MKFGVYDVTFFDVATSIILVDNVAFFAVDILTVSGSPAASFVVLDTSNEMLLGLEIFLYRDYRYGLIKTHFDQSSENLFLLQAKQVSSGQLYLSMISSNV